MGEGYIVTVETKLNREVICTLLHLMDIDGRSRPLEITSFSAAESFVADYQKTFPDSIYHIYRLDEVQ